MLKLWTSYTAAGCVTPVPKKVNNMHFVIEKLTKNAIRIQASLFKLEGTTKNLEATKCLLVVNNKNVRIQISKGMKINLF